MSACFSFALTAGNPIGEASAAAGTNSFGPGCPNWSWCLLGGFTTNFIWCVLLNIKQPHRLPVFQPHVDSCRWRNRETTAAGRGRGCGRGRQATSSRDNRVPMARNYFFCALAGTHWYFQFFFYTMGETQMGKFGFASWTLHMASIIIFSTMWGWIFHEWKGASKKAHGLIAGGIAMLILSTIVIGLGTYLKGQAAAH